MVEIFVIVVIYGLGWLQGTYAGANKAHSEYRKSSEGDAIYYRQK